MAWVRTPDDLYEREEVLAVGLEALALHQAALGYSNRNLTDGRIPATKARTLLAVEGAELLVARLVGAGWWTATDTGFQLVYLLDLQPTAAEVSVRRERSQRRQEIYSHPERVRAVRDRDGDDCRYCGQVVDWHDRRGPRGGTYDHIDPDGPNTVDNLVVACRACNSRKGGRTPEQAGMQLRQVPVETGRSHAGLYQIRADRVADRLPENLSASRTRSPDPEPGPGSPVPDPSPTGTSPEASGGPRAGATAPRAKTANGTNVRLAQIIDDVRACGVPIHPTGRDGSALKSCAAPAELIAEAYVAAARGEWDPVGDGFIRGNLSLHLVIDRLAGYSASQRSTAGSDFLMTRWGPLVRDRRALDDALPDDVEVAF